MKLIFKKSLTSCCAILLLLFVNCTWASRSKADIDIQTGVGYSVLGKMNSVPECNVKAIPVTLGLNYEGRLGKVANVMMGATFQHQFISYVQDTASFSGANLLVGGTVGWNLLTLPASFWRLEVAYYPYNVMTVTSETQATVNGVTYNHSTLTTLTGPGATEIKLAFISEQKGGQFNKHERLRYGFMLTQLTQPFTKSEISIASSNSDIAPRKKLDTEVEQTLALTSALLLIGIAF